MNIDISIRRVRAYRAAHKLSVSGFGVKAGLSPDALRYMDSPDWNPRAETLRKLEALIPADFDPDAIERDAA